MLDIIEYGEGLGDIVRSGKQTACIYMDNIYVVIHNEMKYLK